MRSTQGTLAAMLGLRRPTLKHILKTFERQGLLCVDYGQVDLLCAVQLGGVARSDDLM